MGWSKWWWCVVVGLATGCAAEESPDTTQHALDGQVCGFEVLPSPQTLVESSCEHGRTVFGPTRYERERGKPTDVSAEFDVSTSGEACITIRNGDGGEGRISSGRVSIGDSEAAVPSDFNQQVDGIERTFELAEGTHSLDVQLASGPGSFVEVEVREPYPQLTGTTEKVGPNGALRITNVATDHPLLTPNGDGHHDSTVFNVDGEPLIALPGKDDGTTAYYLEWTFFVVDLDSCATIDTGISGQTLVNSPTNVNTSWDGTLNDGTSVASGNYAYYVEVSLVREDGFVYDTVQSDRFGMIVDTAPANYDEQPQHNGECNPATDPFACRCPGAGGIPTGDTNCTFADPHPGHGNLVRIDDPTSIDRSFITTTQGDDGRWKVTADMRAFNEGGYVVQNMGTWASEAELRTWVAEMSGVPAGTGDSLFNFDYTQVGTSTALTIVGVADHSFNHFFLDAITDAEGNITIGGQTTNVAVLFNDDSGAPAAYTVVEGRVDDECTASGNLEGTTDLRAKLCADNTAFSFTGSNLGVYQLRSSVFDVAFDGATTSVDELCVTNAIFSCAARTFSVPADSIAVDSSYYAETPNGPTFAFAEAIEVADSVALSVSHDRAAGADGVCTRAVASREGLVVRMDSADGSVPSTCVTNGIFF